MDINMNRFGVSDKVFHILGFGVVTLLALMLLSPAVVIVALMLILGIFIETVQSLIPGRTASLADFLASAGGVVAAWAVWRVASFIAKDIRAG